MIREAAPKHHPRRMHALGFGIWVSMSFALSSPNRCVEAISIRLNSSEQPQVQGDMFQVSSRRTLTLRKLVLCALKTTVSQIRHQTGYHTADFPRVAGKFLENTLGEVVLVEGNVELAPDFTGRAFGYGQELQEFLCPTAFVPFGDVRHD